MKSKCNLRLFAVSALIVASFLKTGSIYAEENPFSKILGSSTKRFEQDNAVFLKMAIKDEKTKRKKLKEVKYKDYFKDYETVRKCLKSAAKEKPESATRYAEFDLTFKVMADEISYTRDLIMDLQALKTMNQEFKQVDKCNFPDTYLTDRAKSYFKELAKTEHHFVLLKEEFAKKTWKEKCKDPELDGTICGNYIPASKCEVTWNESQLSNKECKNIKSFNDRYLQTLAEVSKTGNKSERESFMKELQTIESHPDFALIEECSKIDESVRKAQREYVDQGCASVLSRLKERVTEQKSINSTSKVKKAYSEASADADSTIEWERKNAAEKAGTIDKE